MKPSTSNSSKKRAKKEKQKASASRAPPIMVADDEVKARRALDLDWLMGAFSSLSSDQIVSAYDDTGRDPFKAAGILASQLADPGDKEEQPPPPPPLKIEEIEEEKEEQQKKKGARERRQKKVVASSGMIANVIGKGYANVIDADLQQKVLESLFKISSSNSINKPSSMNWKKAAAQRVESFWQGMEYRKGSVTEPLLNATHGKEDEYDVCRSVARKHWDSMRTCYKEAAVAYSSGHRAHAALLSNTGRVHANMARKADERASRELFQARNRDIKIKNTVIIDLHGQHVKEGIGLLKLHLLLFTYIPSVRFLKVITGWGRGGAGKGKLKRSVTSLVNREGIQYWQENIGALLLRLDGLKEYSFTKDDGEDDYDEY